MVSVLAHEDVPLRAITSHSFGSGMFVCPKGQLRSRQTSHKIRSSCFAGRRSDRSRPWHWLCSPRRPVVRQTHLHGPVDRRWIGRGVGDVGNMVGMQGEAGILLLAFEKEKVSFTRLAAAAQACSDRKAKRLYNHLALEELKHLLTLLILIDGLADDSLAHLNLSIPRAALPDPMPQSEEAILQFISEEEGSRGFFGGLAKQADRTDVSDILESLRADEEDHRGRLLSLLYGMEVDHPEVLPRLPAWLRSIRRSVHPMRYQGVH